jgi:hypothetical protein
MKYSLPSDIEQRLVPRLSKKARFIAVPSVWATQLEGAPGRTYGLALHLLYVCWRHRSETIPLANKALAAAGISRQSKWRALRELERRGLVVVQERNRKSPVVRLQHMPHS